MRIPPWANNGERMAAGHSEPAVRIRRRQIAAPKYNIMASVSAEGHSEPAVRIRRRQIASQRIDRPKNAGTCCNTCPAWRIAKKYNECRHVL